jgi:hypothetical protein
MVFISLKIGCYSPAPLKMNLTLEILTDWKRNLGTLLLTPLPSPKLLLPLCGDSIAPCTSLSSYFG